LGVLKKDISCFDYFDELSASDIFALVSIFERILEKKLVAKGKA
jgi:hypothetical protein